MNDYELKRIVEAVLFVSEKPMTVKDIWQSLFCLEAGSRSEAASKPSLKQSDADQFGTMTSSELEVTDDVSVIRNADSQEGKVLEEGVVTEEGELPETVAIEVTKEDVLRVIVQLQEEYSGRGCELSEVASGYRFQVNSDLAVWVQRWKAERPPRYSRAVLETLAIIAYKQPITRAEIEDIRGVAVSSHIVKGLLEREWVRIVGHKELPGRPALLATTKRFLDYFNVTSLEELPTLAEIKELGVRQEDRESEPDIADSTVHIDDHSERPHERESCEASMNHSENVEQISHDSQEIEAENDIENTVESSPVLDEPPSAMPEFSVLEEAVAFQSAGFEPSEAASEDAASEVVSQILERIPSEPVVE